MTARYWRIGKRLLAENLSEGRAAYGQQILASLAQSLEREFGKGFSYSALTRMVRFAELFPDEQILVSLIQELTWTHFLAILPLKDPLAREFYAEMCRVERWSVRTLRQKIGGMLFERTALSKHSEDVVRQELASLRGGQLSPELVFRDPYLLDFLGLSGTWSEKDLEVAILREMEALASVVNHDNDMNALFPPQAKRCSQPSAGSPLSRPIPRDIRRVGRLAHASLRSGTRVRRWRACER
ncbi:DUF1016 N-terminal domain-containing protein [Ralstonia pseudosolanacearum]|uniref:DUF1016 family protein n=1 Tax=Ralstonia solanacearum TaxID=305 RepID=A0AA92IEL8_RALSL|nr:DUF1016 N-terminal domain-containing protein [Ralstonia pseudosolanacearum]QCX49998.1 DUF1016 family protein [Ralstonia pseudosolanacearum]